MAKHSFLRLKTPSLSFLKHNPALFSATRKKLQGGSWEEKGARALCLCSEFKDDTFPLGLGLLKTQESHGNHLTTAVCYREIKTKELCSLVGWSSLKKKSVDSLLPLYGGLIMLKNKAGLKKKLVSAIWNSPKRRWHKYNMIAFHIFRTLHPWTQRPLSTRPCECAHLPSGLRSAKRGQKHNDISTGVEPKHTSYGPTWHVNSEPQQRK